MKRLSWLLVVPLALVSASSMQAGCREFDTFTVADGGASGGSGGAAGMAASSSSSSGSGGSMGKPCKMDVDCAIAGPETECHKNGTCVNDFCVSGDPPNGTLLNEQTYGDCYDVVCDGNGGVNTMKQNQMDKYVWGNSCYVDTCGTAPSPNVGSSCTTGWNKPGKCNLDSECAECATNPDCMPAGMLCETGKCVPSTCKDMMLNAGETDVDCGGPCVACAIGMKCSQPSDCQGAGLCLGNPKICNAPACDDLAPNGDETDLDCGGSCVSDPNGPKTCATGLKCLLPADCTSGRCESGKCK